DPEAASEHARDFRVILLRPRKGQIVIPRQRPSLGMFGVVIELNERKARHDVVKSDAMAFDWNPLEKDIARSVEPNRGEHTIPSRPPLHSLDIVAQRGHERGPVAKEPIGFPQPRLVD